MVKVYIQYRCCTVWFPLGQTPPPPGNLNPEYDSPGGRFALEPDFSLIEPPPPSGRLDILYDIDGQNFKGNSNMTWFFPPIQSTDTNSALFPDISALAHWQ